MAMMGLLADHEGLYDSSCTDVLGVRPDAVFTAIALGFACYVVSAALIRRAGRSGTPECS